MLLIHYPGSRPRSQVAGTGGAGLASRIGAARRRPWPHSGRPFGDVDEGEAISLSGIDREVDVVPVLVTPYLLGTVIGGAVELDADSVFGVPVVLVMGLAADSAACLTLGRGQTVSAFDVSGVAPFQREVDAASASSTASASKARHRIRLAGGERGAQHASGNEFLRDRTRDPAVSIVEGLAAATRSRTVSSILVRGRRHSGSRAGELWSERWITTPGIGLCWAGRRLVGTVTWIFAAWLVGQPVYLGGRLVTEHRAWSGTAHGGPQVRLALRRSGISGVHTAMHPPPLPCLQPWATALAGESGSLNLGMIDHPVCVSSGHDPVAVSVLIHGPSVRIAQTTSARPISNLWITSLSVE